MRRLVGAAALVAAIFGDATALVPGGNLALLPGNRVVVVVVTGAVVAAVVVAVAIAIFASDDCRGREASVYMDRIASKED